jgi:cyclase
MLAKRIIPCLDVKAGRVVKGVRFLELQDAGDPVEIARVYDREGADELCFLDITASHENRGIILDVVARTAEQVFMPLTVGGGINKLEDIRELLKAGADKVSRSIPGRQPPDSSRGPEMFGASASSWRSTPSARAIAGRSYARWTDPTGIDACEWAERMENYGAGKFCSRAWTATAPRRDTI